MVRSRKYGTLNQLNCSWPMKTASDLVKFVNANPQTEPRETVAVKCSKAAVHRKTHRIPEIRFEDQRLTSFAGLVVFQSLFSRIGLKQQLASCFRHLTVSPIYGHGVISSVADWSSAVGISSPSGYAVLPGRPHGTTFAGRIPTAGCGHRQPHIGESG